MKNPQTATNDRIKKAFIELLQEKDYMEISVREIASHAGIGFKTLYRHYKDKSAIANEIYDETWEQLIAEITLRGLTSNPDDIIRHLVMTVQKNAHLMRAFVVLGSYQDVLPQIAIDFSQKQISAYRPDLLESDSDYAPNLQLVLTTYFMNGQIELIRWWLTRDNMTLPVEAMVSMMLQLVIQPIMNFKLPDLSEPVPPQS